MSRTSSGRSQCISDCSMKGDVKGKISPLTGKSEFFGPDIQPLVAPAANFVNGPVDLG
jgi:hypothetical protein